MSSRHARGAPWPEGSARSLDPPSTLAAFGRPVSFSDAAATPGVTLFPVVRLRDNVVTPLQEDHAMQLAQLGWNSAFETEFAAHAAAGLIPARVSRDHGSLYAVIGEAGEMQAQLAGRLKHAASSRAELPAVGDWVALGARPEERAATIHAVLPRRGQFSRKVAGTTTEEQVVAANVDTAFLVAGLDQDFSLRRLERYLAAAYDGGATPVIVLNKADLCDDLPAQLREVASIAIGVSVHAISAIDPGTLEPLRPHLRPGQTVALLGSSGVGKSTLTNTLLGDERQQTHAVRPDDSRGRHTTTYRELILLPRGAL